MVVQPPAAQPRKDPQIAMTYDTGWATAALFAVIIAVLAHNGHGAKISTVHLQAHSQLQSVDGAAIPQTPCQVVRVTSQFVDHLLGSQWIILELLRGPKDAPLIQQRRVIAVCGSIRWQQGYILPAQYGLVRAAAIILVTRCGNGN